MLIEGVKVLNAFGNVFFDDDDNGNDQTMTMMKQGVQQQVASPGSERSVEASADVGSICTLFCYAHFIWGSICTLGTLDILVLFLSSTFVLESIPQAQSECYSILL